MDEIHLTRICNGWIVTRTGGCNYQYYYKTSKEALKHIAEEAKVLEYEPGDEMK